MKRETIDKLCCPFDKRAKVTFQYLHHAVLLKHGAYKKKGRRCVVRSPFSRRTPNHFKIAVSTGKVWREERKETVEAMSYSQQEASTSGYVDAEESDLLSIKPLCVEFSLKSS